MAGRISVRTGLTWVASLDSPPAWVYPCWRWADCFYFPRGRIVPGVSLLTLGLTYMESGQQHPPPVYPCLRGANWSCDQFNNRLQGISLLARGQRLRRVGGGPGPRYIRAYVGPSTTASVRYIPAYAGPTPVTFVPFWSTAVYPCLRGANCISPALLPACVGVSLLARGQRGSAILTITSCRYIPACAGPTVVLATDNGAQRYIPACAGPTLVA